VKFTDQGGVAVTVERGAAPDQITFIVRDTGIGIAPEAQPRVFEEFEQADDGRTRKFGGTGLGLAISRRIVERMGGELTLESAPGQGSTFRFTVALAPADVRASFSAPDLSGQSILIVAPGAIEAPLVAQRLEGWGAHVRVVRDEATAHVLFQEHRWDTLIVDRALGPDVAATLVRAAPSVMRRIVLLTPAERHELADLKAAGFTGYLVKPVRAASLAARVGDAATIDMADTSAAAPTREPNSNGLSVLVAEDNDINALLVRALLHRLGHRPIVVANGAAAVETFLAATRASTPYDLVLMDVHMPELDGMEATRRIRAAEASLGLPHTRIVALTANAFGEDRDACLAAGMDDFLVKPLERDRLDEVLAGTNTKSIAA
jgi:CheY-like chemotaxis protein